MRRAPIAPGTLALLDDVLDRLAGCRRVDDRHQLRPAERVGAHLGLLRADEQPILADLVGQVDDAGLDRPVEVTDGVELLAPRDDVGRVHDRQGRPGRGESFGVFQLHPLGTLEEEEVAQGPLAEGHEGELHPGRVALRLVRHVRAGHVRCRPHGREDVVDERPVEHLMGRYAEHHRAPPFDGLEVFRRQRLVGLGLQAEGGVQVLAHQPVFELGRLAQEVGERLAILDDDGWFRRHCCGKLLPGPVDESREIGTSEPA